MNLLSMFRPPPRRTLDELDRPLLYFSPTDPWTVRHSFEGVSVMGATGSGKTTGAGATLARAFLRHGYGGVVLTVKPDERRLWENYARETGRSDSLIIVSPAERWRFNIVEFEAHRPGRGGGMTENLTRLFSEAMEVAERRSAEREDFWSRASRQLLRNSIDLLSLSGKRVTLADIYQVIITAPDDPEQLRSADFQAHSVCLRCLREGERRPRTPEQQQDWRITSDFWQREFLHLSSRTRSCVVSTVTTLIDPLQRGLTHTLFGTTTNFVPEVVHEGAIVILDLPVAEFGSAGQLAQILFKFIWQKSTERRDVSRHGKPVFLWADEAQYFATSHDAIFQSTARSARTATVYLTQNLPGYLATIGAGGNGQPAVHALMGNLATKIFHANTCPQTNLWAAETIARHWQFRGNSGTSTSEDDRSGSRVSRSVGATDTLNFQVEPHEFTLLRKGGSENDLCVDAFVFQAGRIWNSTQQNHVKVTFRQS